MKKQAKKMAVVIVAMNLIFLSGCLQQRPLEKLGLITAAGFDLSKKNNILGTVVYQQFDPLQKNVTKKIIEQAKTSKGLRQDENLQTSHKLVSGQMRIVIYSKELAKRGIIQLIDTLNRDPTIGNMLYVTISDGKAVDLLTKNNIGKGSNLGTFLYNLIKQNVEGEQVISPTLHEFNHDFYDVGKDPVLPVLKLNRGDIVISSMALFKNDRMVGELKPNSLFFLKVLVDSYKAGSQEVPLNAKDFKPLLIKTAGHREREFHDKIYITIDNINSSHKIKLLDKDKLRFSVKVKLKSRILEMTEPMEVGDPKAIKFVEKKINEHFQKEIGFMIKKFQTLGVDPVGFGNEYNTHLRGKKMTKSEWREKFKEASFDIVIDNQIVRTGVID